MNITQILSLTDLNQQVANLKQRPSDMVAPIVETLEKQFDVTQHKVFDITHRPKKMVRKNTGEKDSKGVDILATEAVEVARIAFPFQETIVKRAASFLFGSDVGLSMDTGKDAQLEKVSEMLKKILSSNKAGNLNKQIARALFSETEVAEYWYPVKDENYWGDVSKSQYKLRCKIFSPFLGDSLYPHFDEFGDMDAFSRGYYLNQVNEQGSTIETEFLDCFTRTETIRFKYTEGKWEQIKLISTDPQTGAQTEVTSAPNMAGRIPIVYYYQKNPDWYGVQALIERFEDTISNFADTNDYFGRPILTLNGSIDSMPDKGEAGKIIQLDKDVTASYLTWDQAPEAIKLELDYLEAGIYANSQTPNIAFDQVKGIGSVSGIALKLLFLDAHLKAQDKIEIFGTALQRRFNIIKGFIGTMDNALKAKAEQLEVTPIITPYMPSNEQELLTMLVGATAGKAVMSQKTAVKLAGQVDDVETEFKQIKDEEETTSLIDKSEPTI